jgi:prevent-host-death family protein
MTEYSIRDLSRKSEDIIAEAMRKPVTITQRNKPRLILTSVGPASKALPTHRPPDTPRRG